MDTTAKEQRTISKFAQETHLLHQLSRPK
jgi:hypothetical protein